MTDDHDDTCPFECVACAAFAYDAIAELEAGNPRDWIRIDPAYPRGGAWRHTIYAGTRQEAIDLIVDCFLMW